MCCSDGAGQAPVDADILPGDIGRVARDEVADEGGDLLGVPVAAHRNTGATVLSLRQAADKARQDIVHADIIDRVFVGEEFGEGGKASAKNTGGREEGIGLERGESGDIDDRAAALFHHNRRD